MSLLIKALDKAQAEKAQASKTKSAKKSGNKTKAPKAAKAAEALTLEEPKKTNVPKPSVKANQDEVPKALQGTAADNAQQTKPIEKAEPALALTPSSAAAAKVEAQPRQAPEQAQAANVFTAKNAETRNRTATIAMIVGLLALVMMAALAYWYQTVLNAPDVVIPPRPVAKQTIPDPLPELPRDLPVANAVDGAGTEAVSIEMIAAAEAGPEVPSPEVAVMSVEKVEPTSAIAEDAGDKPQEASVFKAPKLSSAREVEAIEETLAANETVVSTNDLGNADSQSFDQDLVSEKSAITITPNKTDSVVTPVLMRAYEAYNAGNDLQAQQDYKAVLKRYGPNVDAMLGLGAIATRQGRLADANGWYRKVLEVEPRNEVAKAGLLSLQQSQANTPAVDQSQLKSMIATAPNDANLHAALGDVYASQNQWSAAQQAYFDAYRLSQSAENTFNLAVSLDQLGKPGLALPYYREALQKAGQSNAIDVEALQARISSIE